MQWSCSSCSSASLLRLRLTVSLVVLVLGSFCLTTVKGRYQDDDLYLCYGPPQSNGRVCEAPEALIHFTRIKYSVFPIKNSNFNSGAFNNNPANTNVCCDGRGAVKGREVWVPLGCSPEPFSRATYFDALVSFPAIRCSGSPNGVFVHWTY